MAEENNKFETSDLAIAAFLMLKGHTLVHAGRHTTGRFSFVFEDDDQKCKVHAVEFLSSDCCKFDTHVKNLKKLIY